MKLNCIFIMSASRSYLSLHIIVAYLCQTKLKYYLTQVSFCLYPLPKYEIEYKQFMLRYTAENYWGEDEEYVKKITHVIKTLKQGIIALRKNIQCENIINCVTKKGSLLNYAIQKKNRRSIIFN